MSDETFLEGFEDVPDDTSSTEYSAFPRSLSHSRELVQYVNRFQTYPSNNSRSLALYIADFYNPQMGYSFPSQEKMATSFSTNTKTIRRWLKEIESTGYWIFRKGGKDNSTRYIPSDKELLAVNRFLRAESRHERTGDDNKKVMPNQARNDNFAKEETVLPEVPQKGSEIVQEAPQELSNVSDGHGEVPGENKPLKTHTSEYEPSELPSAFPAGLPELYKEMLYNGTVQFKHPACFGKLNHRQTELIITMVSYLVHSHAIKETSAPKIAKNMADIWVSHPETDLDVFYNRTMHYLCKNNTEIASHASVST